MYNLPMLKKLSELSGVSGDEGRVREYIKSQIANDCRKMIEDPYGNLIVSKRTHKKLKVMLAAHMDEVGVVVIGIEKDGLLKFKAIGLTPQVLIAKRISFEKNHITGVIGHKPVHLSKDEERKKYPEIKDLFIDIGVSSKEEANKLVEVGTCGTFDTTYRGQGDTIYGKAFDNRIGCYMLVQLIKNTNLPVHYAFTVQEEAGLRGARIVAFRVAPQIALAIDTTASAEWPVEKDVAKYPAIGKGPVITVADRSIICDQEITNLLRKTAEDNGIPYQNKQPMIGGTDAGAIHLSREGIRTGVLSTAARYIHSPLAIASKKDIDAGIRLLELTLENIFRKKELWN